MDAPLRSFIWQLLQLRGIQGSGCDRAVEDSVIHAVFNVVGGVDQTDGLANVGMMQYRFGECLFEALIKNLFDTL